MPEHTGNILGELTAETDDRMLQTAFYESRNFRELARGSDFRFVVGRRGSGKSALFRKVTEALDRDPGTLLITERPSEDKARALHHEMGKLTSQYLDARMVTRLTWKIQVLTQALETILEQYKASKLEQFQQLEEYRARHSLLFEGEKGLARSLEVLRQVVEANPSEGIGALPEKIANHFQVGRLQNCVADALRQLRRRIVFLYDGLDEGWVPNHVATGVLGGLAMAAADFREGQGIHCRLFIRDNMFRALAELDGDYTRNIEGNTLRLHWDEESLLHLVALRLRAAFSWKGENSLKAWNRFAQRGLEDMDGFRRCLKLTLYRPRDLIALINGAYQVACQDGRECLIGRDLEVTATRISKTRLADLFKEYEHVLPGLPQFAHVFESQSAQMPYAEAQALLDAVVTRFDKDACIRDFALLRTGAEAFNALYSVGFFGVQDADGAVRFCHDGSNTDVQDLPATRTVVVHPCYWRALDLRSETADEVTVSVDDEDDVALSASGKKVMTDMRLRQLGRIVEELHKIPEGKTGAHPFEAWVHDAARYLFAEGLENIQWKPNPGQLQQRDIVGTLKGTSGFWRRVDRYEATQFIIEAKNFREMDADVFRQAWGYLNPPYGRCLMIVTRADEEGLTERERALVKEGFDGSPRKLLILMPARLLQRALSKMRSGNEQRDDYIEDLLKKRMDTFERRYTAQKAPRVSS